MRPPVVVNTVCVLSFFILFSSRSLCQAVQTHQPSLCLEGYQKLVLQHFDCEALCQRHTRLYAYAEIMGVSPNTGQDAGIEVADMK